MKSVNARFMKQHIIDSVEIERQNDRHICGFFQCRIVAQFSVSQFGYRFATSLAGADIYRIDLLSFIKRRHKVSTYAGKSVIYEKYEYHLTSPSGVIVSYDIFVFGHSLSAPS